MSETVSRLNDRTVLAALSQATADVTEQRLAGSTVIASQADARAAIAALLAQQGVRVIEPESVLPDERLDPAVAREVLDLLLEDSEMHDAAEEATLNPPADTQKSVELAAAGAVILASLVTWLQTSVEIELHRKDGMLEFGFKLKKAATGEKTLVDIANTIGKLIP
jgi:hypothetical protein